jgi:citrate lyase subunit beta / citryl-CoA lyase
MLATSHLVRRSVLLVPLLDPDAVMACGRHNADAVALEPSEDLSATREALPHAIETAQKGGAEVFVRVDKARAYAQIKAAVRPGLTGVVVSNAESAAEIAEVDDMLREREREEGVPPGTLEIFPLLGTARGIWDVREVVNASPRVACAAIDEVSLARSFGITPSDEFDPLGFCRGRVIVETLATVRVPLGIGHPLGANPRDMPTQELLPLVARARNTGFKGAVCYFPAWVEACNTAFTPSDEQVAYYRDVRKTFAEGVARGTAAVPFPGGRMIDVPVDERARLELDWWERCQRREAAKLARRLGADG